MTGVNPTNGRVPLPPADRPIRNIGLSESPVIYANNVALKASIWDFSLDFGRVIKANNDELVIQELTTVILSPAHAKAVAELLTENVRQYEAQFGVLPKPAQRPDNEGMSEEV